jgi:hypothetical protein
LGINFSCAFGTVRRLFESLAASLHSSFGYAPVSMCLNPSQKLELPLVLDSSDWFVFTLYTNHSAYRAHSSPARVPVLVRVPVLLVYGVPLFVWSCLVSSNIFTFLEWLGFPFPGKPRGKVFDVCQVFRPINRPID